MMREKVRLAADWRHRIVAMPRLWKRAVLVTSDFLLLSIALWLGFSLRLSTFYVPPSAEFALLLLAAPAIGVAIFSYLHLYRLVTRFIGWKGSARILLAVLVAVMAWSLVVVIAAVPGVLPRSVFVMYAVFSAVLVWTSRQVAGWLLSDLVASLPLDFEPDRRTAIIYGAGQAGVQLAAALRQSKSHNLIGFIDEDRSLWGQNLAGLKVYRPLKLSKLVERNGVQEVFLAMPGASKRRRRTIIRRLEKYPVLVKMLPAMADIATGKVSVTDLRPVDADDLLGRDPVPPDVELMRRHVFGKCVMVTGAGGSIGSELARQIVDLSPRRLVLYERSEVALYEIERELRARAARDVTIVALLESVNDDVAVRRAISRHGVETIYHAAAYKHVPIVELNAVAGLRNNTFGTLVVADAARDLGVERFVLISTDKAVRPTNIMGASKRLAELVLQAFAESARVPREMGIGALGTEPLARTVFTMVRFGNVLDSSGSVVRLFREQIAQGGPVTVTHPEITRYFMSIPEAATLVIQAGAMGEGGDVFVLDMGTPVKIADLARSMVRLSGLEVQDDRNRDGDIAITYTGLRPGEKLYEELLIGANTTGTSHPLIARNREPFMSEARLLEVLARLDEAMAEDDIRAIHDVLRLAVEDYQPEVRHLEEVGRRRPAGQPHGPLAAEPAAGAVDGEGVVWRQPGETVH
ncbi:MAG: NAD-dependent epimerase/dehydratase family protein [Rhizobiales bacterium]|nr:NAD-dependent epimerase/dehydratase family protein [Hyphomicrobiales bacterium]